MAACNHPRATIQRLSKTLWRCGICLELRGTMDFGEYIDMLYPPNVPHDVVEKGAPWRPIVPRAESWK